MMADNLKQNVLLSIAGFDGTGGAGISTDIKICAALKIPHAAVITSIVPQSPFEVFKNIVVEGNHVIDQLECIRNSFSVDIINVGLIGSIQIFDYLKQYYDDKKIIFDPLFSSGSGQFDFKTNVEIQHVFQYSKYLYLLTPNIPEAEYLAKMTIHNRDHMKEAAFTIQKKFNVPNVLLKGGHLQTSSSVDLLLENTRFTFFKSQLSGYNIHGTGSFLNAAISAYLFLGNSLIDSVAKAKILLDQSVRQLDKNYPILTILVK